MTHIKTGFMSYNLIVSNNTARIKLVLIYFKFGYNIEFNNDENIFNKKILTISSV